MKLLALLSALSAAAASDFCPTIFADLERRQLEYFDSDVPYTIEKGAKHVPVLTVSEDGKTATVVVGNGDEEGGVWHPMKPSGDPDTVHWVTHILVKDQVRRRSRVLRFSLPSQLFLGQLTRPFSSTILVIRTTRTEMSSSQIPSTPMASPTTRSTWPGESRPRSNSTFRRALPR